MLTESSHPEIYGTVCSSSIFHGAGYDGDGHVGVCFGVRVFVSDNWDWERVEAPLDSVGATRGRFPSFVAGSWLQCWHHVERVCRKRNEPPWSVEMCHMSAGLFFG